ncbi:hypothetical protein GH714_034895 [Hevea brasiliensis]|uniref:Pentacotripeptide-repeat region of PRORP domain-containing protein n=1 Tax=Hevea brasiliensis TaxID=3981 RepID=A0A6A6NAB8_HEVBR|nr:hypothetical protein GH714_034895 [Hevea brasiliensis]
MDRLIRHLDAGRLRKAISTLDIMSQEGTHPDLITYSLLLKSCIRENNFQQVIRACSNKDNVSIGQIIFGSVIKSGYFDSHVCVGCALIDMFVMGSGDFNAAYKVFDKMTEKNVITWTLLITRLQQFGYSRDAIDFFINMVSSEYIPDKYTLSGVVSACAELRLLSFGQQLHSWAIKSGLFLDVCVGCSLVDMYAKCATDGFMADSRKVFDRISDHNVMSWTAIVTGYVQSGGILKACANLSDLHMGEQVYTYAVKLGLASVNCVGNSLISMYARCGNMENARKTFNALFEKNLISYNTIVNAYAKSLNSEESFELFIEIEDTGTQVDTFTFASLLSGASSIGAIGKGEQIHARILKSGFNSCLHISNALISMYSRCGDIEAAFQVFNGMGDRNVISWTSMVTGFAKHGFAVRALETFHKMLEAGVRPNEITYIAVLSACSHVGLISERWKHFKSMSMEHGIVPRMEHYACMVDLLGRSGCLEEAMEFINSMPFKADALVLRTFLGACRVHGNINLGKHAAR